MQNTNFKATRADTIAGFVLSNPSTWEQIGIKRTCDVITEIRMPNRGLTGTLSNQITQLDSLKVLDLSNNKLKINEMSWWVLSGNLRVFNISNNRMNFYGSFNGSFYAHADENYYDTLDLSGNQIDYVYLYGDLPRYINLSNDSLKYVSLMGNETTGGIVGENYLDGIKHVDLSHNLLNSMPPSITNMDSLEHFDIGNNRLYNSDLSSYDYSNLKNVKYFAIDSNAVVHHKDSSGITSLPKFPKNSGLRLNVAKNHLDFEDLHPYKNYFKTNDKIDSLLYRAQFDSVDVANLLKPAVGSRVILRTNMEASNTQYSWTKNGKLINNNSYSQVYSFKYLAKDSGRYSVKISHADFPGLTFVRRPIDLKTCGDTSLKISLTLKGNDLSLCDTLRILKSKLLPDTRVNKTGIYSWYFNDFVLLGEYRDSLAVKQRGEYNVSFLRYDNCMVTSDSVVVTDADSDFAPKIGYDANTQTLFNKNKTGKDSLQWFINDMPIAAANDSTLKVYLNGKYGLSTRSSNISCVLNSVPYELFTFDKGFERTQYGTNAQGQVILGFVSAWDMFPNPATDMFSLTGLENGSIVQLQNSHGTALKEIIATDKETNFNITGVAKGVYFVKVNVAGSVKYRKLVVE